VGVGGVDVDVELVKADAAALVGLALDAVDHGHRVDVVPVERRRLAVAIGPVRDLDTDPAALDRVAAHDREVLEGEVDAVVAARRPQLAGRPDQAVIAAGRLLATTDRTARRRGLEGPGKPGRWL